MSNKEDKWTIEESGYGGFAACYLVSTLTPQPNKPEPVSLTIPEPRERKPRKYKK